MISAKIQKRKNKDLKKVLKHFKEISGSEVAIGYFDSEMHDGRDDEHALTLASLATILEKGKLDGEIPPRPIWEETALANQPNKKAIPKDIIKNFIGQVGSVSSKYKSLGDLGEFYRDEVRYKFGRAGAKGNLSNARSVIERKGHNSPWLDTGQLMDEIKIKKIVKAKR